MSKVEIFNNIKRELASVPRNKRTVEIHIQMLKYAEKLNDVTAKEFCEEVGLAASYGTEFSKMRNLIERLSVAGLDVQKL